MNSLRPRGQLSVYHSRKFDVSSVIFEAIEVAASSITLFTASAGWMMGTGPVGAFQCTIVKGKIREVIGEFRFEGEEGARMGVPHQTFLILVSPNPLFYDLIKEES